MKFTTLLAAGAAATFAMLASAQAQDTTTPPAEAPAAVPASACGDFPTPPPVPGAQTRQRDAAAQQAIYDAWRAAAQTNLTCRSNEYRTLQAQANARASEYEAARTTGATTGAAWQAAMNEINSRRR